MVRKNLPTTTIERELEYKKEMEALYWDAYQLGITQPGRYGKEKLQELIELKKKKNPKNIKILYFVSLERYATDAATDKIPKKPRNCSNPFKLFFLDNSRISFFSITGLNQLIFVSLKINLQTNNS